MKRLLHLVAVILLASSVARGQAVSVTGSVVSPSGSSFGNGRFLVQMPNPGVQNTCVSPSVVVPTAALIVAITNGAFSTSLIPTDCLSQFIPYRVTLQDNHQNVISTNYWYIPQHFGSVVAPANGSKYIYPAGLTGALSEITAVVVPQTVAGFQFITVTQVLTAATTLTLNWPKAFADTSYVTNCSFLNPNGAMFFYFVFAIASQTTSSIKVTLDPSGSASPVSGKLTCFAREPQ